MTGEGRAPTTGGIPTASGVDHVGFNVPDLDAAIAFFTTVLGFTLLERSGRIADEQVIAGTQVAMLAFGDARVELLQFATSSPDWSPPAMEAPGGCHLALTVADLDAALIHLGAHPGTRLARPPDQLRNGRRRAFVLTPWGATIQLITPQVGTIF
jgi:catechol 2,3-dioxygenase-like lactoylglutathione lyase family enzyme